MAQNRSSFLSTQECLTETLRGFEPMPAPRRFWDGAVWLPDEDWDDQPDTDPAPLCLGASS